MEENTPVQVGRAEAGGGKGQAVQHLKVREVRPQGSVATLPALQHSQTLWAFGQGGHGPVWGFHGLCFPSNNSH